MKKKALNSGGEEKKKSWIKRHPVWSLVILLVVLNLVILGAVLPDTEKNNSSNTNTNSQNNYQASQQATQFEQTSKTWHYVTTFRGSSDKTTDTFDIKGDKFKLFYDVNPANDFSVFYLYVYREGNSYMTDTISLDSGSEESIIYEGKGNFYLDISATNLDDWEIKIEDYY